MSNRGNNNEQNLNKLRKHGVEQVQIDPTHKIRAFQAEQAGMPLNAHRGTTMQELNIWRTMQPQAFFGTNPQQAVEAYGNLFDHTRGIFRNALILDTETMGRPISQGGTFFGVTEIAMRPINTKAQPLYALIQPDDAVQKSLAQIMINIRDNIALTEYEWRAARDLVRYSNDVVIDTQGAFNFVRQHASVSHIPEGSSLRPYLSQIEAGYKTLMARGNNKMAVAEAVTKYTRDKRRNIHGIVTFKGRTADLPWLHEALGIDLSQQTHLDLADLYTATGAHRLDPAGTNVKGQTMGAFYARVVGKTQDVAHSAFQDTEQTLDLLRATPRFMQEQELIQPLHGNKIGTGLSFDTQRIRIGDKFFTVSGSKAPTKTGKIALGAYDFNIDLATGKAIDYGEVGLRSQVVYSVTDARQVILHGKQVYRLDLLSEDAGVKTVLYRETKEELQNFLQKKTILESDMQRLGLTDTVLSGPGKGYKIWEAESARRTYERMTAVQDKKYKGTGMELAKRLYSAALGETQVDGEAIKLTPTEQRMLNIYGSRVKSEARFALDAINQIENNVQIQETWQQDLLFKKVMRQLKPQVGTRQLQPHNYRLQILSHYGTTEVGATTERASKKLGERKYKTITLANLDGIKGGLEGILGEGQTAVPAIASKMKADRMLGITRDLFDRGILTQAQVDAIQGQPTAHLMADSLSVMLLGDATDAQSIAQQAIIKNVQIEGTKARRYTPKKAKIDAEVNRLIGTRGIWDQNQLSDDALLQSIRNMLGETPKIKKGELPHNYDKALFRLAIDSQTVNLRTMIVPRYTAGQPAGAAIIIAPDTLKYDVVYSSLTDDVIDIPGAVAVNLPRIDSTGMLVHGNMKRIGIGAVKAADDGSLIYMSPLEQLTDRMISSRVIHRASTLVTKGRHVEAQQILNRFVSSYMMEESAPSIPHRGLSSDVSGTAPRGTASDRARSRLIDLSQPIKKRAEALMKQDGAKAWESIWYEYRAAFDVVDQVNRHATSLGISGLSVTGKSSDIASYTYAMDNVQDAVPFGMFINPSRDNLWQFQNYLQLGDDAIRQVQERERAGLTGVTTDRLITTKQWLRQVQAIGEPGRAHLEGLNVRGVMMTDQDIQDRLKQIDTAPEDVKKWLNTPGNRMRLSVYENMGMIDEQTARLFDVEKLKEINLTEDQAARLTGEIEAGRSLELRTGDEILTGDPNLTWIEAHEGKILGIEKGEKGYRLKTSYLDHAASTTKYNLSSGEKLTLGYTPSNVIRWLSQSPDAQAIYAQDYRKHADIGAMIDDRIRLNVYDIKQLKSPGDADALRTEMVDRLNQIFLVNAQKNSRQKAIKWDRVSDVMETSELISRTSLLDVDRRNALIDLLDEYDVWFDRDKHVHSTMTQLRRANVDAHMSSVDIHGDVVIGDTTMPRRGPLADKGMKVSLPELHAMFVRGTEARPVLDYLESKIEDGTNYAESRRLVRGMGRMAGALQRPAELAQLPVVGIGGHDGLEVLAKDIGEDKYGTIDNTILRPRIPGTDRLMSAGDVVALRLPAPLTRGMFQDALSEKDSTQIRGLIQDLPDTEMNALPLIVYPHNVPDESGRAFLHRDAASALKNVQDAHVNWMNAIANANEESMPIDKARKKMIQEYVKYLDYVSSDALAKDSITRQVLHSTRLDTSGRFRLQGVSPHHMETLPIDNNTVIMNEKSARNMLKERFEEFFDTSAVDKHGFFQPAKDTELVGLGLRNPTISQESFQPVIVKVSNAVDDNALVLTPTLAKLLRADYDDDHGALHLVLDDEAAIAAMHKEIRESPLANVPVDETRGIDVYSHRAILSQGDTLMTKATATDVLGSKLSKGYVGLASNTSAMLRLHASMLYDQNTADGLRRYKLIESIGLAIEQHAALSSKHVHYEANYKTHPLYVAQRALYESNTNPEALNVFDDLNLGAKEAGYWEPRIAELKEFMSRRIGQAYMHQSKVLYAESTPIETLTHLERHVRGLAPEEEAKIRVGYHTNLVADDIIKGGADNIKIGDVIYSTFESMQGIPVDAAPTDIVRPQAFAQAGPKITGTTAKWALGIAVGVYAFQRLRNTSGIVPLSERPQPDQTPTPDGNFLPQALQGRRQNPPARITENNEEGMDIRIRGNADTEIDREYLANIIANSVRERVATEMNVNIHTRDSRAQLTPQYVNQIVADVIGR